MQKKIAVLITFLLSILIQLNSSSVEWIGRAEVGLRFSNDYILLKVGEQRKLGHKYFVQNVSNFGEKVENLGQSLEHYKHKIWVQILNIIRSKFGREVVSASISSSSKSS